MTKIGRPASSTRSHGFIMIAVLWITLALATLASIYSVYVANTAVSISVIDGEVQTNLLTSTSLELTAYALSGKQPRPTTGAFSFRLGGANVAVAYSSEAARMDLNAAPVGLLAGLFVALGSTPQLAQQYAARIDGWRTPPPKEPQNPDQDEDRLYVAARLHYLPRRGPFANVEELRLVLGMPPAVVDRALPFLTIFTASSQINILEAAPEILAALPGMSGAKLNAILDQRARAPSEQLIDLLGVDPKIAGTKASDAIRVRTRVVLGRGRQTASEVVIRIKADPYRVLSWRDYVDVPSGWR